MKNLFKLTIFFLIVLVNLEGKEYTKEEAEILASKVVSEFNQELKVGFRDAKDKGGIEAMADFCINDSKKIFQNINTKYGNDVTIKRVSLNNRNENAKAVDKEINILKAFELIEKSNSYLPKYIVQMSGENNYNVFFPIEMDRKDCKKCHGVESKVDESIKQKFYKAYKNNSAFGYESGEVRGAFVVNIKSN